MRTGSWTAQYSINATPSALSTWTNMPTADTFLFSSTAHIILADISGMTYVRFKVNKQGTTGKAGAKLVLRYSPAFSSIVTDYMNIGMSEVSVLIDSTGYMMTDWIQIDPSAQGYEDVYLAVIGNGGNGTVDPQFGNISVSFC